MPPQGSPRTPRHSGPRQHRRRTPRGRRSAPPAPSTAPPQPTLRRVLHDVDACCASPRLVLRMSERPPLPAVVVVSDRIHSMVEVRQTNVYRRSFRKIKDRRARARILTRIRRLSLGNPGDARPVGEGVSELRIDYGPGYRVYYVQRGETVVVLLAGGDKDSQDRDIRNSLRLARNLDQTNRRGDDGWCDSEAHSPGTRQTTCGQMGTWSLIWTRRSRRVTWV